MNTIVIVVPTSPLMYVKKSQGIAIPLIIVGSPLSS